MIIIKNNKIDIIIPRICDLCRLSYVTVEGGFLCNNCYKQEDKRIRENRKLPILYSFK